MSMELVRADYLGVSNTFRTLFEFALSIWSGLVGVLVTEKPTTRLFWVFFWVMLGLAAVFAGLTWLYGVKAKGGRTTESKSPPTAQENAPSSSKLIKDTEEILNRARDL
jgi:hypothetical protein